MSALDISARASTRSSGAIASLRLLRFLQKSFDTAGSRTGRSGLRVVR